MRSSAPWRLNLHGLARFTEGLDLFIGPDADNINRLRLALHSVIDDPEIENITAEDLLGDYPAVQYIPPDGAFRIDILTKLGDAFSFADLETELVAFGDITVSVVTAKTLFAKSTRPVRFRPGVRRFRSVAELKADGTSAPRRLTVSKASETTAFPDN
jgi:hypothetical protein